MIPCKSPKANLERCTRVFLLLGLVLALLITELALKTQTRVNEGNDMGTHFGAENTTDEDIPEANIKVEIPIETAAIPPTPSLEQIKIVADDKRIVEKVLTSTETDEKSVIVVQKIEYSKVKEVKVVEEVVEDVPFFVIEDVPKYPGCTGNKEQLKKCMEDKIQQFVMNNFNADIAQELGLESGVNRIFIAFVIDKNGNITNVQSRAPHKKLQIEAERIINSLPKMEPGKQRGKPVGVKYSLPIVFQVMEN